MSHSFFIRTATRQDVEAISQLLRTTWHHTYDAMWGPEQVEKVTRSWHSAQALMRNMNRPSGEFLVADNGEMIAGVAFAAASEKESRAVILYQLYVLPEFQRCGIGADLLKEILDSFPEASRIKCEVEQENTAAMNFYQAHGFSLSLQEAANKNSLEGGAPCWLERPL